MHNVNGSVRAPASEPTWMRLILNMAAPKPLQRRLLNPFPSLLKRVSLESGGR